MLTNKIAESIIYYKFQTSKLENNFVFYLGFKAQ